ncbi:hypothetical protein W97_02447 [Coniosporium apollinis CBS 100218]|uniref:Breast carcinoma amplified sequence 2 n=1 Tax=Coniosporium apollinis (strain CBS 100218) TaxID=1168221 RepID=R7YMR1_CONA1|nr:uncharacterized protein W97_02447 [Coniosporium apollinis CBS 100218]EON63220.1 hypothetical protein W97_02447 [Coniosporium apollinis CBS 100218]
MPLVQDSSDDLPYIDQPAPAEAIVSIRQLIHLEASSHHPDYPATLHPSVPTTYQPTFSALLEAEHARLSADPASKIPGGIDTSRYEEPQAPSSLSDVEGWKSALRQAYATSSFLSSRSTNLGLLEAYGKNAWLISNSQNESILRDLEAELAATKDSIEAVEAARRNQQEAVVGEMRGLEEGWKKGVGRLVETSIAAEGVRREILQQQRQAAV